MLVAVSAVFAGSPGCGKSCKSGNAKCALASEVGCGANKASGTADASMSSCGVCGMKLTDKAVSRTIDNHDVRFCSNDCADKFEKDKTTYIKKMDDAVVAAQKASYPLDVCVVSGEKLGGSMGAPVDYVYKGQLVRFCCGGCIDKFEKDPQKYLDMLKAKPAAEPAKAESAK
jgi:YHS domain-containing protein